MRKTIREFFLLSILLFTITATPVTTVFASLGTWSFHAFAMNISGTSDGIAGKLVNDPVGALWAANIATLVEDPPISLNLGWNWFSGSERCGTVYVQNIQGDPYYAYTQQRGSTIFLTTQPCALLRWGMSSGKHIVTAGGTNYYETSTRTEIIP